jgi:glycerol uptake facilitator protein
MSVIALAVSLAPVVSLSLAPAVAPLLSPDLSPGLPRRALPRGFNRARLFETATAMSLPPDDEREAAVAQGDVSLLLNECVGECFGTFVLMTLGCGVGCTAGLAGVPYSLGQVAVVWGMAVTLAISVASRFSEAHLNPAVTLALYLRRAIGPRRALSFVVAQLVGSLVGSLVLCLAYLPQLSAAGGLLPFQLGPTALATSPWMLFAHEAWGSGLLLLLVFSIADGPFKPPLVGAAVATLISVVGPLSGAGFNPARDLGPRISAALLRATLVPKLAGGCFDACVPFILGPLVGGALAAAAASWLDRLRRRTAAAKAMHSPMRTPMRPKAKE